MSIKKWDFEIPLFILKEVIFMSELRNKLSKKIEQKGEIANELDGIVPYENKIIQIPSKQNDMQIDGIVPEFAISLDVAKQRLAMLQGFVKEMMIEGVDYGQIPGTKKPSLYKSGAEKLCDIFGFSKQLEVINRVENWDNGFFHYEIKVILVNKKTGLIEAEGIGSCNSKEKKYVNQDSFSIINTVAKMAKKRALIDAVLSATRSSGIFTQDVEDMDFQGNINKTNKSIFVKNLPMNKQPTLINKEQQLEIIKLTEQNQIPLSQLRELMKEKYGIEQTRLLTYVQADELIDILKLY